MAELVSGPYRTVKDVGVVPDRAEDPVVLAASPANCGVVTAGLMPSGITLNTATAMATVVAPPPLIDTVGGDV